MRMDSTLSAQLKVLLITRDTEDGVVKARTLRCGSSWTQGARIQPISAKLEATGTCHGSPSVSLFQELDYLSASCSWDEG